MDHQSDLGHIEEEATSRDGCDIEAVQDLLIEAFLRAESVLACRGNGSLVDAFPQGNIQGDGEVAKGGVLCDKLSRLRLKGSGSQEGSPFTVLSQTGARRASGRQWLLQLVDIDHNLCGGIAFGAVGVDAEVYRVNGELGVTCTFEGQSFGSTHLLDKLARDGRARFADERTEQGCRPISI